MEQDKSDAAKANTSGSTVTPDQESAVGKPSPVDPEVARKIAQLRSTVRENFGKAVMALLQVPRYRNLTLADLQPFVLEPLLRDRLAIAYPGNARENPAADMAGFAIWASVSKEADGRIREQIREGVFPIRLKPEDWNSGKINWLLDIVATDSATTASVIGNFRQLVKEGDLRLHPLISRLVDPAMLEKMGARKSAEASAES